MLPEGGPLSEPEGEKDCMGLSVQYPGEWDSETLASGWRGLEEAHTPDSTFGQTLARCFHSLVATGAHGSLCSRYNQPPQMGRPRPEVTSGRAGTGPESAQAQASSGPSGASVT